MPGTVSLLDTAAKNNREFTVENITMFSVTQNPVLKLEAKGPVQSGAEKCRPAFPVCAGGCKPPLVWKLFRNISM